MKFLIPLLALASINAMAALNINDSQDDASIKKALRKAVEEAVVECRPVEPSRVDNRYSFLFYGRNIPSFLDKPDLVVQVLQAPSVIQVSSKNSYTGSVQTLNFHTTEDYSELIEIVETKTRTLEKEINIGTLAEPEFVIETSVVTTKKVTCNVTN